MRAPLIAGLLGLVAFVGCGGNAQPTTVVTPTPSPSVRPPVSPSASSQTTAASTTSATTTTTPTEARAGKPDCASLPPAATNDAVGTLQRVVCLARAGGLGPVAAVQLQIGATGGALAPGAVVKLWARGASSWEQIGDLSKTPVDRPFTHGQPGQIVETLAPLDFDADGTDELVIGVLALGASSGPLTIGVMSFRDTDVAVDFREDTSSGGNLTIEGRDVLLETGSYGPGDPHCCPSGILRQRIGWNPDYKKIEVREQSVTPVTTKP